MMILDYLFYKISRIYRLGLGPENPDIWASSNLAVLLFFTVWIPCIRFGWFFDEKILGGIFVFIFVFTSIYFNKRRLLKLEEKYKNEPIIQRDLGSFAVALYAIGTFVAFFMVIATYNKSLH